MSPSPNGGPSRNSPAPRDRQAVPEIAGPPSQAAVRRPLAGIYDDAFEHQAFKFDGRDIVVAFKPVTGRVHLCTNGALECNVGDLEGSLAIVTFPRLRMGHVRPNVRGKLYRFAGCTLEAGTGHPVLEDMREIYDHLLGPVRHRPEANVAPSL